MRKTQLLKSLLVAVMLCVGASNVFAAATVIYGRALTADADNGYTAWSNNDVAASGTDLNVWIGNFAYNQTYGLYQSASGNRSAVMTFAHTDGSLQTFDIVFNNLGNTGNASNYSYIKIGSDIEIQSNQQNQNGTVIINGNSSSISDCNVKNYNRGGDSWTIHVEINTAQNKLTALTIVGTEKTYGSTTKHAHYTLSGAANLSNNATFNTVTIGFNRAGGTPSAALTSIRIMEEEQDVTNADYTINYKYGENVVKTISATSAVGATITADAAINGDDNQRYLIIADEAPSMALVAGNNELNVPVRPTYKATLKVTNTINGTANEEIIALEESDSKSCAWRYPYSKYVKSGDVYYLCDANTFVFSGTFVDGDVIEKSVSYSTADESIVYFGEVEDLANAVWPIEGEYSGGTRAAISGSKIAGLTTLPAGIYEVSGVVYDNTFRGLYLRKSNSTEDSEVIAGTTTADGNILSAKFVLYEETSVNLSGTTLSGKVNQSADLDYVMIKKLSDGINTMSIVGDFSANGWVPESGIAMTQDTGNPHIWTAVVEKYVVTSAKYDYQYKAVANGNWTDWVIGNPNASNTDKNQEYGFGYVGDGMYKLTFTANTKANTVELAIEKQATGQVYFVNTNDWADVKIWVWDANNSDYNYTGGTWPGHSMTATGEQQDGHDVYTWSTYDITGTPTTLIISNGGSDTERTGNRIFVNGATYKADGSSTETKTITAAGYATFCSLRAVDFSSATGLTAYIAKKDDSNNVTFSIVTKVPANTGVLLKGEAGEYTISSTYSNELDDVADNAFVGVTVDTKVAAGSFVLMNGTSGVGFYKTAKEFTVGANTAYIAALSTSRSFIGFNFDEATGIESVATVNMNNGEVYNLNGQRVSAAKKGLYIMNGKKVVLK